MKILFFCSNFYPETAASANRTYAHAKEWVKLGNQVTIVTCFPNYPLGKIFPGYKLKFRQVEYIDGIKVVRIASYFAENKGIIKRVLSYLSYGLHACLHGLLEPCDVVIGTSPQPFNLLPARCISFWKRKKFVFELRDIWPESIMAVGAMRHNKVLEVLKKWIYYLYVKADLIVVVTESFKRELIEQKIPSDKIFVVKNGADIDILNVNLSREEVEKKYQLPHGKLLVGFVGTIGMAHALEVMVEAAEKLRNNDNIFFIIMGSGAKSDDINHMIVSKNLTNIKCIAGGPRQEAIEMVNALDLVVVHLRADPLFTTVIPSKIFEAMYLKKPILLGVDGEVRTLIEDASAGIFFQPENSAALLEVIFKFMNDPALRKKCAESGYDYVIREYDRSTLAYNMLLRIQRLF